MAERTTASVTKSSGGESMTICVKRFMKSLSVASIMCDESSSAGSGGRGPAGKTQRFGTRSYWIKTSSREWAPVKKLLKPFSLETPSVFATEGRRKSASTIKTGPPLWAKDIARLQAVEVFPSPTCALVTSKVCGGRGAVESKTEVRRLRNASASGEDGRLRTANPTPFGPAVLRARSATPCFRLYPSASE